MDNTKKSYFDLTPDEHEAIAQQGVKKAIAEMHAAGVATVEVIDGKRYLWHPDGSLTEIKRLPTDVQV